MNQGKQRRKAKQMKLKAEKQAKSQQQRIIEDARRKAGGCVYLNMDSQEWLRGDYCDVAYRVPLGTSLEHEVEILNHWRKCDAIFGMERPPKSEPTEKKKGPMGFQTPTTPPKKPKKKPPKKRLKFKRAVLKLELVGTEL